MRKNVNNDVNKDSPITVLQSRSQRPRSFCTATGITYVWKNPKKERLRLAEKNRVYHMQISLLIKKPWARGFDFDRSYVYTQISLNLKPLRKTFTSISSEMTLQWHFIQRFPFFLFLKVIPMLSLKRSCTFLLLNLSNLLILSTRECVSSWLMHQSIPATPNPPPPPPPPGWPPGISIFLPWMANSRRWGLLSCQIPRGGDEKRGQIPHPLSTRQLTFFIDRNVA